MVLVGSHAVQEAEGSKQAQAGDGGKKRATAKAPGGEGLSQLLEPVRCASGGCKATKWTWPGKLKVPPG